MNTKIKPYTKLLTKIGKRISDPDADHIQPTVISLRFQTPVLASRRTAQGLKCLPFCLHVLVKSHFQILGLLQFEPANEITVLIT